MGMRRVTEGKLACFEMGKGAPNLKFRIVSVKTLPLFGHVVLLSSQPILCLSFCPVRLGRGMQSERGVK